MYLVSVIKITVLCCFPKQNTFNKQPCWGISLWKRLLLRFFTIQPILWPFVKLTSLNTIITRQVTTLAEFIRYQCEYFCSFKLPPTDIESWQKVSLNHLFNYPLLTTKFQNPFNQIKLNYNRDKLISQCMSMVPDPILNPILNKWIRIGPRGSSFQFAPHKLPGSVI